MGKDTILQIETDDFMLSFVGPVPNCNSFALRDFNGACSVESLATNEIINIVCGSSYGSITILRVICHSPKYNDSNTYVDIKTEYQNAEGTWYLPLFYENVDYLVQLSPKNAPSSSEKLTLWHEHSTIMKNLVYFDKHNMFSGSFNFRNNVGFSEFYLKQGNRNILTIQFAVFSLKIGFLEERYYMMRDLARVHNNLIYELFNSTKSEGTTTNERASGLEWLTNFYTASENIIKIAKRIEKRAHSRLNTDNVICSVNKIKKTNKSLNKQISKYGKGMVFNNRNVNIEVRVTSFNTQENRYLKYLMRQVISTSKKWINHISIIDSENYKAIKNEHIYISIVSNTKKIEQLYKNDFWSKVEDNITTLENKTNFLFHDEFVQFEKLCRRINKAINLETKGTNYIYTLSMEELYEVWTFCKLAQVIGGIVYSNSSAFSLKIKTDAFRTILKTGQASKIRITDNITISTNRQFMTDETHTYFSPFVSQKPDLVFEIENRNVLNVLDAKYRIDVVIMEDGKPKLLNNADLISEDLSGKIIIFKTKDSDINTMHRYKDAIQTNTAAEGVVTMHKAVKRGVILYPYKPKMEEARQIKQYLDKMELFKIGSIPLAPGAEDDEWINKYNNTDELIFDDTAEKEQIRILANQVKKMLDEMH